jgi:hypothetical protein
MDAAEFRSRLTEAGRGFVVSGKETIVQEMRTMGYGRRSRHSLMTRHLSSSDESLRRWKRPVTLLVPHEVAR